MNKAVLIRVPVCQSHTGRLTGLWFLPYPAFGLNTTTNNNNNNNTTFLDRFWSSSGIFHNNIHGKAYRDGDPTFTFITRM